MSRDEQPSGDADLTEGAHGGVVRDAHCQDERRRDQRHHGRGRTEANDAVSGPNHCSRVPRCAEGAARDIATVTRAGRQDQRELRVSGQPRGELEPSGPRP